MLLSHHHAQAQRMPRNRLTAGCLAVARAGRCAITRISRSSARRAIKNSRRVRRLLIVGNILRHPWQYYIRRKAAKAMATRPTGITIPRADGFVRFGASDFEEVSSIVRLCQQISFDEKRALVKAPPQSTTKQKRYLVELLSDDDLIRYPRLVDFACPAWKG